MILIYLLINRRVISKMQYSIATLNLFNFLAPPNAYYDFENIYTLEQWQRKCEWIRQFLNEYQPDIIGFQEVFSAGELQELLQTSGYPYFVCLDTCHVEDEFIYSRPVVALASKYPIIEATNTQETPSLNQLLGLANFSFSRQPLRATVELPDFGKLDCYVVHFKSKRSAFNHEQIPLLSSSAAAQFVSQQILGNWGLSLQRANEATLLSVNMLARRAQTEHPFVLMGDFNDSLNSDLFSAFVTACRIYRSDMNSPHLSGLSEVELTAQLNQFRLYDSYQLHLEATKRNRSLAFDEANSQHESYQDEDASIVRAATHYFGDQGSVLDYILVSSEFDPKQLKSMAHICNYQTVDGHLVRPDYERDAYSSDHAPVVMSFTVNTHPT